MNDEAVYRTAPATPGLLNSCTLRFTILKQSQEAIWESMLISEQRGIGHRLCPGGRDPASESASAARLRGQGPGTRKGPGREQ